MSIAKLAKPGALLCVHICSAEPGALLCVHICSADASKQFFLDVWYNIAQDKNVFPMAIVASPACG